MLISIGKAVRGAMFTVWRSGSGGSFEADLAYPMAGIVLTYFLKTKFLVEFYGRAVIQTGLYRKEGRIIVFKYIAQHRTGDALSEKFWMHYQALDMGRAGRGIDFHSPGDLPLLHIRIKRIGTGTITFQAPF